jgi:hypothetical protein
VDRGDLDALTEVVSELAVRLLAEPERIRWTGEVVPLVDGERVVGGRAAFTRADDGELWALVAVDGGVRARLSASAERCPGSAEKFVRFDGGIPHAGVRVGAWTDSSPEVRAVEALYGERRARRSGVRLIRHIFEGIAVLRAIGASELAIRGFCVHPLVQSDEEFVSTCAGGRLVGLDPQAVALAVEYRAVANGFLSTMEDHPGYGDPAAIRCSPLAEVNAMLVADKIQNAKDFERFHRASHPRAAWLRRYFDRWLEALGVTSEARATLTAEISLPTARWGVPESIDG